MSAPSPARAQTAHAVVAGDGSFTVPVNVSYAANGAGFGLRLGARVPLPWAEQTLELGFGYAGFGTGTTTVSGSPVTALSGFGGMRLGFAGIVKPGLFLHFGFGHLAGQRIVATDPRVTQSLNRSAVIWDGGAYIDLAITSFLELGVQASYNQFAGGITRPAFQWFALGGHLQIVI